MTETGHHPQVGYILRSYPRLSQTFILNEILALEQLGLSLHIFAVTNPREPIVQAQVAEVRAPVHYLELGGRRKWPALFVEHLLVMLASPLRYFKTLHYALRHKDLEAGCTASSRYECLSQAVYLTRLLEREKQCTGRRIGHLHAHFAHDPTLIALLTHLLTGVSFSFTAHARDLYQTPQQALAERMEKASVVVTCCDSNIAYLTDVTPESLHAKVQLIYHGVDLQGFQPASRQDGWPPTPLILSVGRLVEKKGFPDLLRACQRLKQAGYHFRCEIYGDGPLRNNLDALIEQLGLRHEVALAGARTQQQLLPMFQRATAFVLTPFVTEDDDRDGIPNVLVEAMACGLPVVSTTVAGIPELVRHGHNGLLVKPHDVEAVAAGLAVLLDDESRRQQLGAAARQTVVEHYDLRKGAFQMAALFDRALKGEPFGVC